MTNVNLDNAQTEQSGEQCDVSPENKMNPLRNLLNSSSFQSRSLEIETILKALGDRTRIKLILLLSKGELCVCDLSDLSELSQPTVSNSMIILERAGVVKRERRGRWHYYSLTDNEILHVVMKFIEG
jgi:Predicted transcriptional regulators